MYECIIIGSGPAGITASIYMARAGLKVLIISKNDSKLRKAEKIENYYGFENPISGDVLNQKGINQAKNLGIEFLEDEVIGVKITDNGEYEINVVNQDVKQRYITKKLVIATGVSRNIPQIKGMNKLEGKGLSYCAVCDGFLYKNKKIAVLGYGNYAIKELGFLLNSTKDIVLLTNGNDVKKNDFSIEVNKKKIKELLKKDNGIDVIFDDDTCMNVDGIFVAYGVASCVDFAKKLGAKIEKNYILVNEKMETGVPNVYACGDCTGGILQISKAVYQGTIVGLEVAKKIYK